MKKTYEKPMLAVEYYQLTQTIASCATKIGLLSDQCVLKDPDATPQMKNLASVGWFVEGNCSSFGTEMDQFDGICYHTNANAAFSS